MARKLIGIEPRPQDSIPRPSVAIESLPDGDDELIRLWTPQARLRAEHGESASAIARFLVSKGVSATAAAAAAGHLRATTRASPITGPQQRRFFGFLLLGLGLLGPIILFFIPMGGSYWLVIPGGIIVLGARLLWEAPDR